MRISFAFCFAVLLTITVSQLYASEIISKNGNKEITTENGTDILVTEPELMEVIVTNNNLTFEICTKKCFASFLVCYEPDPPEQSATDFFTMCDNNCGFYVTGDVKLIERNITVGYMGHALEYQTKRKETCDVATMSLNEFEFRPTASPKPSCKPKIENGMVKLNVSKASSDCPVIIKKAQFKRDPPTTTVLPSNNDSSTSSSGNSSSNVFGISGWIFALLSMIFFQL